MLASYRAKPHLNEKHKQILESLNDLDNFNVDLISSIGDMHDMHDSLVRVNDTDTQILRKSLLFKNWHTDTFNKFIEEKHVSVRKMKYKQVIANGRECHEKVFIIKSGEMLIWIKVSKNHIRNYQKKLSKYLFKEKLPQTDINKAKYRFKRDRMVDIDSIEFPTNNKPPMRRSESMLSMTSVKSQPKPIEPPPPPAEDTLQKEDDNFNPIMSKFITRKSFSAFAKSTNDFHVQLTIRSMSSVPSRRPYEFSKKLEVSNETTIENENDETHEIETKQMKHETHVEKKAHFSDNPIGVNTNQNESDTESDNLYSNQDLINESAYRPACFVKMMKLNPGEIFGMSDFLFDDAQSNEIDDSTANSGSKSSSKKKSSNDSDSDDEITNPSNENEDAESINGKELNSKNLLNYYFISNSRQLECYVIDKEYYLKNMQTFTEDKNIISKYLQSLRNECVRTPSNDLIDQLYVQQMNWNQHKKKILNEQLKHNMLKKPLRPINLASTTPTTKQSSNLKMNSQKKKFHF